MTRPTRRRFLGLGMSGIGAIVGASRLTGQQGLGQFTAPTPPCTDDRQITPAAPDERDFKPGSPQTNSLMQPVSAPPKLWLTGLVIGVTCGPIKDAVVDIWHADERGIYDARGFRYRGHQLTDATGRYRFGTIRPGPVANRARHINVRVQPPGRPVLSTQIFFPDDPMNSRDASFKAELLMRLTRESGVESATFNFVLNI